MQIYDVPSLELWGRGWGLLLGRCGVASPHLDNVPPRHSGLSFLAGVHLYLGGEWRFMER